VLGADDAGFVELDGTRALGLSARPIEAPTTTFALDRATALLFYTDGLVERRGAALAAFGDGADQLVELRLDDADGTAGAVCDAAIARCLRGVSREDDICLLAVLRAP
jgi:hypothetical protein